MTNDTSLTRHIVAYLVVAQLVAFLVGAIVTLVLNLTNFAFYRLTLDEMAAYRVSALVIQSLDSDENGRIRIMVDSALRAETERTPQFRYAAFEETRAAVAGSSPDLVSALTKAGVIQLTRAHVHFNLPGDAEMIPLGYMERRRTPFGWLHIAVYRQKFHWTDVVFYLQNVLRWMTTYILVVVLLSTAAAWFAVRRGFSPLRVAARQVEQIDMDALNHSVVSQSVPVEIRPFVDAIDAALTRIRASTMRMRRFTANAAHEMRTPLAIMRVRLDNASASSLRSDLLSDSNQLRVIVEQMLIAVRLFENQAVCDEMVDLEKVVQQVVSGFLLLALRCGRKIEFEGAPAPVITRGNQRAIECIVSNLIDNALRTEPEGGTVLVRVGNDAIVEVVDHGEGVAPADREVIFEPFWRKTEVTPGTGLGLAISKELMEKLSGRIWVEETPGGGATFKLSFSLTGEAIRSN